MIKHNERSSGLVELSDKHSPKNKNGKNSLKHYFSPDLGDIVELIRTGQVKVESDDDENKNFPSNQ